MAPADTAHDELMINDGIHQALGHQCYRSDMSKNSSQTLRKPLTRPSFYEKPVGLVDGIGSDDELVPWFPNKRTAQAQRFAMQLEQLLAPAALAAACASVWLGLRAARHRGR